MSQADELLMSLEDDITGTTTGNIVVGADRFITVPDSLKRVAIQYDHDIETVTFDCPRYWDGHDLSQMRIYVNYMRADAVLGSHLCSNVVTDAAYDSIMHFDWTISGHVTYVSGTITFLICVKNVDADGNEENIWHTEINSDMYVSMGMKCHDTILRRYPDIITQLLYRMDQSEAIVVEAREAKEDIENMSVTAETLPEGQDATVEKTIQNGVVNLHFGLPKGGLGSSIESITLTSGNHAPGTLDTYTITLDDGTTTTFQVYNGADGEGSGDMLASVYDPQGKHQDIFAYIDTVDIDAGEW